MTTIYERVKTALTGFGLPMGVEVYIPASGTELPDDYLVYFVISDPPIQHADNVEKTHIYRVQVSYFSRSGMQSAPDISSAMVADGFMRAEGRDLPYNPDTRHYGQGLDFTYLEEE